MTEEIRPICLYVETCLDKKEGTRDCAKCEHHLNYWTEVMIRDMEKNIIRLEQENKELLEKFDEAQGDIESLTNANNYYFKENKELKEENITAQKEYWKLEQGNDFLAEKVRLYRSALEEIKEYLNTLSSVDSDFPNTETYLRIQGKISEVLND